MSEYAIKYESPTGEIGVKKFQGQNKAEARYKFKFLYPDYLILKIKDTFTEDYENMLSTVMTGKF